VRGLSPRFLLVERAPHPALRATFSHKGRREEGKKGRREEGKKGRRKRYVA
jgi:hypothetical protein